MYKLFFVKRWRAWPFYDCNTGELLHYTVECRIDRTRYTPQMVWQHRLHPTEISLSYGSDELTFLKPLFRQMNARLDKALEDYVANL
jgi:hypothetical protein